MITENNLLDFLLKYIVDPQISRSLDCLGGQRTSSALNIIKQGLL